MKWKPEYYYNNYMKTEWNQNKCHFDIQHVYDSKLYYVCIYVREHNLPNMWLLSHLRQFPMYKKAQPTKKLIIITSTTVPNV